MATIRLQVLSSARILDAHEHYGKNFKEGKNLVQTLDRSYADISAQLSVFSNEKENKLIKMNHVM